MRKTISFSNIELEILEDYREKHFKDYKTISRMIKEIILMTVFTDDRLGTKPFWRKAEDTQKTLTDEVKGILNFMYPDETEMEY